MIQNLRQLADKATLRDGSVRYEVEPSPAYVCDYEHKRVPMYDVVVVVTAVGGLGRRVFTGNYANCEAFLCGVNAALRWRHPDPEHAATSPDREVR